MLFYKNDLAAESRLYYEEPAGNAGDYHRNDCIFKVTKRKVINRQIWVAWQHNFIL